MAMAMQMCAMKMDQRLVVTTSVASRVCMRCSLKSLLDWMNRPVCICSMQRLGVLPRFWKKKSGQQRFYNAPILLLFDV
jgi:hypothetical protein